MMTVMSDNVFLLKLNAKELCEKINISSSLLLDHLREHGVITQHEDEYIRVRDSF